MMSHKFTRNANILQAFMVPITIFSFLIAIITSGGTIPSQNSLFSSYDIWGLLLVGLGVFVHNWFEEKPQMASI